MRSKPAKKEESDTYKKRGCTPFQKQGGIGDA